jgi:hypothetical protein
VLASTYEEPKTPPEIRETVGTSLQNVHYHLDCLEEAGLLEPAGTGYSAKGNEMTVYAPAREAVVLFAGAEADGSRLRDLLKRLFGLFLFVGVSTLLFAALHGWLTDDPGPNVETMAAQDGAGAAGGAASTLTAVDPAVAFFLGGSAVVCALGAWWYLIRTVVIQYRPRSGFPDETCWNPSNVVLSRR